MTAVVIDTSVAIKWAVTEMYTPEAVALQHACLRQGVTMIAPTLLRHEAINVLVKKVYDREIILREAEASLTDILQVLVLEPFDLPLSHRAIALAVAAGGRRFGFDAQFLALAEREQRDFWTADEDFSRAVRSSFACDGSRCIRCLRHSRGIMIDSRSPVGIVTS